MKLITKKHQAIIEGTGDDKTLVLKDQGEVVEGDEKPLILDAEKPVEDQLSAWAKDCQEENHKTKKVMLQLKTDQSEPFTVYLLYLVS